MRAHAFHSSQTVEIRRVTESLRTSRKFGTRTPKTLKRTQRFSYALICRRETHTHEHRHARKLLVAIIDNPRNTPFATTNKQNQMHQAFCAIFRWICSDFRVFIAKQPRSLITQSISWKITYHTRKTRRVTFCFRVCLESTYNRGVDTKCPRLERLVHVELVWTWTCIRVRDAIGK